jgi:hypothetical protein
MATIVALIISAVLIIAALLVDLGIIFAIIAGIFYLLLYIWQRVTKGRKS